MAMALTKTAATETTADKDGRRPRREGANNAAKLLAEAAGCPKGLTMR